MRRNTNMVGGDIGGGAIDLRQLLFRPTASLYRTPKAAVHGMCGYHAVRAALGNSGA